MIDKILKILHQKSTWAGATLVATLALPKFGVSPDIVEGIRYVLLGLMGIFLRQGIQKVQDKTEGE